jgi:hypothetical protein
VRSLGREVEEERLAVRRLLDEADRLVAEDVGRVPALPARLSIDVQVEFRVALVGGHDPPVPPLDRAVARRVAVQNLPTIPVR